jgi:hypothetical protein
VWERGQLIGHLRAIADRLGGWDIDDDATG